MQDVAVIGAGIAGLATAARLQARGLSTVVLEAHGQPGGCAGFSAAAASPSTSAPEVYEP
jgi:phytoene dehydrogenase-like protein